MMRGEPPDADDHTLQELASSDVGADCCVISKEALEGAESPTTMRLHGWVQDREVLMLVDSGSSHSFICETLAEQLHGVTACNSAMAVRVANGGVMQCDRELPAYAWRTQGVTFHTDLKVLPLGCYDVILGIDWLAQHSPMNVHWKEKTMYFDYEGARVHLQGARADTTQCQQLSGDDLDCLLRRSGVVRVIHLCTVAEEGVTATELPVPRAVSDLLQEYNHLFAEPRGLPPRRAFDHSIPLLPGAKPVNVRPYRYSPAQKDEVESGGRHARPGHHRAELQPICLAGPVGSEEGSHLAFLCRLPTLECGDREEPLPSSGHRRVARRARWRQVLDQPGPAPGVPPDPHEAGRRAQDSIQDPQRPLRVPGADIWTHRGSGNVSGRHEHGVGTAQPPRRPRLHRRHLSAQCHDGGACQSVETSLSATG